MKKLPILVLLIAVSFAVTKQVHAFRCNEFETFISSFAKENEALLERDAALKEDATRRCTLGYKEILPFVRQRLLEAAEFANCPDIGPKVGKLVSVIQQQLPILELGVAQACEKAADDPGAVKKQ